MDLTQKKCIPCEVGGKPLAHDEIQKLMPEITGWEIGGDKELIKDFKFADFKENMAFVNKVADLAESEGHHPDMDIHGWNKLTIRLSTHAVGGLSENDFILASKIDQI